MKKSLLRILIVTSILFLSACTLPGTSSSEPGNDNPIEDPNNGQGEDPNNGGQSENPSEATVKSVTFVVSNEYHIGDVFDPYKVTVNAKYSDGTSGVLTGHTAKVSDDVITHQDGEDMPANERFTKPGSYSLTFWIKYKNFTSTKKISFNVKSGFDSEGYTLTSVDYVGGIGFSIGHIVSNELREAQLLLHRNKGDEYYYYNKDTDDKGFSFSLRKQGDSSTDYMNIPLEQNSTYNLIISYKGNDFSTSFTVYNNYYKLSSDSLTFVAQDLDKSYSNTKGDAKVLVIPIKLYGEYVDNWENDSVSKINKIYFGETEGKVSMKSYYNTASFGQINISGVVTPIYEETDAELTDVDIQDSAWKEKLYIVLANATEYIKTNCLDINLDDYDLNDDGYIDNAHFITNFNTKTYQRKTGYNAWGTPLWAHRGKTNNETGNKDNPVTNSYSLSSIDMVKDATTIIHEQGHVFGLEDYYIVDYIGGADMQSNNIFDWNSYSKLTVGWVSPYVVTGPTEITISAASLNGDCIIVPANPDTFNNSAYDEYFLIELFSQYGNNAIDFPVNGVYQGSCWEYWERNRGVDLGDYGVRLYHVDSRMQWWDGNNHVYKEATKDDKDRWLFLPISNDYYGGEQIDDDSGRFADCKLLSLIQRGGVDTFGDPYSSEHNLQGSDLFKQGDVFTFAKYKHFLSKCGRTVTTMDNGETFPYKITFKTMSSTRTTVKIELA